MLGLFKSKKSPVRRRLEKVDGVRRTWIEWTIEDGLRTPTLVVESIRDLDPASPHFDRNDFVDIIDAVNAIEAGEAPALRVRVVPRVSDG